MSNRQHAHMLQSDSLHISIFLYLMLCVSQRSFILCEAEKQNVTDWLVENYHFICQVLPHNPIILHHLWYIYQVLHLHTPPSTPPPYLAKMISSTFHGLPADKDQHNRVWMTKKFTRFIICKTKTEWNDKRLSNLYELFLCLQWMLNTCLKRRIRVKNTLNLNLLFSLTIFWSHLNRSS